MLSSFVFTRVELEEDKLTLLLLMTTVAMPADDSRQVTKLEEESSVLPLRLWRVGFLG